MAQMKAEQRYPDHVKQGDKRLLKAEYHHLVDIMALLRVLKHPEILPAEIDAGNLDREVQQMINDKHEDDQPAHHHRARSIARRDDFKIRVGHWPSGPV